MIKSKSSETVNLASNSQIDTFQIGIALASTLYQKNTNLWFRGELGAGKTTFIQGLAKGLPTSLPFGELPTSLFELRGTSRGASGLGENVVSPTYAIENRYGETFMHIDLYRLDEKEAKHIIEESEDFPGVRAVEWSERLEDERNKRRRGGEEMNSSDPLNPLILSSPSIIISISELSESTRSIEITFSDLPLPSREEIETWRREVRLPGHIALHCDAVARMAEKLGNERIARGVPLRPLALRRACELHDLLRFVDFQPHVQKKIPDAKEPDEETKQIWGAFKKKYPLEHEAACAEFLREQGYAELGEMIRPHGLRSIVEEPETIKTIEQKLLYYADKRVRFETEVSIEERFDEFVERYGNGMESEWAKIARVRTKDMEKELFGSMSC